MCFYEQVTVYNIAQTLRATVSQYAPRDPNPNLTTKTKIFKFLLEFRHLSNHRTHSFFHHLY